MQEIIWALWYYYNRIKLVSSFECVKSIEDFQNCIFKQIQIKHLNLGNVLDLHVQVIRV